MTRWIAASTSTNASCMRHCVSGPDSITHGSSAGASGPGRPSSCDITRNGAPSHCASASYATTPGTGTAPGASASSTRACAARSYSGQVGTAGGSRTTKRRSPRCPPARAAPCRHQKCLVRPARAGAIELRDLVSGVGPPMRAPRREPSGELVVVSAGQGCHTRPRGYRIADMSHRNGDDGALVDDDEAFSHQIVETHARVAQADRSWTEKVCAMAARTRRFAAGRLRGREVHEPQRVRRLRGRVARQGAVDGAREPAAERRTRPHRRGRRSTTR